jgi:hypothetical protein
VWKNERKNIISEKKCKAGNEDNHLEDGRAGGQY